MRLLVCGGRDFAAMGIVYGALDYVHTVRTITELAHGAAPGADALSAEWARLNGVKSTPFPADWKSHGKAAGPMRNRSMLATFKPDMVLAFPGGKGTADMTKKARAAGVRVLELESCDRGCGLRWPTGK